MTSPQINSNRSRNTTQQHSTRIQYPQRLDRRDIRLDDEIRIHSRMQKSFLHLADYEIDEIGSLVRFLKTNLSARDRVSEGEEDEGEKEVLRDL